MVNIFGRYLWLVGAIYERGDVGITFEELNERWREYDDEGRSLPKRTFHKHKQDIEDIFDIIIDCDRRTNRYSITDCEAFERNHVVQWLLNSFSMGLVLSGAKSLRDRILVEDVPSSNIYLEPIIGAMRESRKIEMSYQSFRSDEEVTLTLSPYFVKIYENRWYVYGLASGLSRVEGKVIVLSLDRIKALNLSEEQFEIPANFSAKEHLYNSVGIEHYDDILPRRVVIRATKTHAKYLASLPMHHSQGVIEEGESYVDFEYYIAPTGEFYREILKQGEKVEIISPTAVRERFAQIVRNIGAKYRE